MSFALGGVMDAKGKITKAAHIHRIAGCMDWSRFLRRGRDSGAKARADGAQLGS
jgi:hypothetical protein